MNWDHTFDIVCVGSGAAGMAAALRAHALGLSTVVLEASDQYGGSTAVSGGVVWIPNNPQMGARGVPDTREDAITYLTGITEGRVPEARIAAYVDAAPRMLAWFEAHTHLRLDSLEMYSDYYPERPGGKPGGRSMEPIPFDASLLGEAFRTLRRPHKGSQVMGKFGITAREAKDYVGPSWSGRLKLVWRMVQYALRWFTRRKFHRDTKLHAGNALIGRLRLSLDERQIPLWLETPVTRLIEVDGRIVGVEVSTGEKTVRIRAEKGVVLGAGGFERNQAMRDEYHAHQSLTAWNAGNPRNLGDGIRMGQEVGAAIDNMDTAWWTPVTRIPGVEQAWVLVLEKSLPGSILVNTHGRRFTNEAAPYEDVVRDMVAHDAVPDCFLVLDARFRRNYPIGPIPPGFATPDSRLKRRYTDGFLIKADTIDGLAHACGLDPVALADTVDRFNGLCETGEDTDYGRGNSATDRYYSDPSITPNPCMHPIAQAPFYAIRVYPGDLGTKGGLVTDAEARVLTPAGTAIPGLYAAGNTTATVMGPSYPGAGGTIGPALTFGMIAAETAAADASVHTIGAADTPTSGAA